MMVMHSDSIYSNGELALQYEHTSVLFCYYIARLELIPGTYRTAAYLIEQDEPFIYQLSLHIKLPPVILSVQARELFIRKQPG